MFDGNFAFYTRGKRRPKKRNTRNLYFMFLSYVDISLGMMRRRREEGS